MPAMPEPVWTKTIDCLFKAYNGHFPETYRVVVSIEASELNEEGDVGPADAERLLTQRYDGSQMKEVLGGRTTAAVLCADAADTVRSIVGAAGKVVAVTASIYLPAERVLDRCELRWR